MSIPLVEGTLGHAVPPYPHHAITTHLPYWRSILDFVDRKPELIGQLKSMYPRMMAHADIKELTKHICRIAEMPETKTCLLYPSHADALSQIQYSTDPKRGELQLKREDLDLRAFDLDVRYYAVFFDQAKLPSLWLFWVYTGVGVSSRRAEESLKHLDLLKEADLGSTPPSANEPPAKGVVQGRIADLLERAPRGGERPSKVQPSDVYLFQSGMAAIYRVNNYLTASKRGGATVMYGYAFHCTPPCLEIFSKAWKIFGRGTEEELDELDAWLAQEKSSGRTVQGLWAEFPANPRMMTPNLARLRQLADRYDTILVIDDTVSSFCNVDLLGADGADIVITSLSKSFSGYADLLMGSATLNPMSRVYGELKALFDGIYSNDVCPADIEALEQNSRNYIERSVVLNSNAQVLVDFLQGKADDPNSSVATVMYPSIGPQRVHFDERMRPATEDFTPGYGCLFSVRFETLHGTIAFYDELSKYVHMGPHLGAHRTLALAYVKVIYGKDLSHATKFALDERDIRVSVGFEDDPARLLEIFRAAVAKADEVQPTAEGHEHEPNIVSSLT